jgi:hypothetical protein
MPQDDMRLGKGQCSGLLKEILFWERVVMGMLKRLPSSALNFG